MLKKMIFACLTALSLASFASPAYISHKIMNNTNSNIDVILRQIYALPLDGCMGSIPAHSSKECSGSFDNQYPFFILNVLKTTEPMQDTEFTLRSSAFYKQSVFVTWILDENENGKFTLNYTFSF